MVIMYEIIKGVNKLVYVRKTPKELEYIRNTPYNSYMIVKHINGRQISFGTFKSLKQAKKHRDFCIRNNWEEECKKRHRLKHISQDKRTGRYFIHRKVNGEVKYYGYFSNIIDAIRERDLLIKFNWDIDALWESGEL